MSDNQLLKYFKNADVYVINAQLQGAVTPQQQCFTGYPQNHKYLITLKSAAANYTVTW